VDAVNRVRVGKAVAPLVFIAPPLLAGASPRTAIAIWTLSFVCLAIVIFFPLRSLVGGVRLPGDRGFYRRVITYGGKISALRAIDTLNDRVGLLALAAFATEAAVGVFSVAVAAFEVLMLAPRALLLSAFRRIGISSPGSSAALTCRAVRHSFLFTAVGGPLLLPFVWIGVPLTIGDGYQDVPWLFALLIPNAVCRGVLACLYTYFQIQARSPVTLLKVGGWALVANVGLTIALTPPWGTWGVAVAASLSGVIGAAVAFREFQKESGARLREVIPGRAEFADYLALAASLRRRRAARSGSSA
jgi:O-antigen/teichoic acid export membrane protein